MDTSSSVKILRRSIYIFLQNYQTFTFAAPFIALPFAALLLLLSDASFIILPVYSAIHNRVCSVFDALGLSQSVDFFTILNLNLSYTIVTYFLVLPFTLTFLLLAKAYIIQLLSNTKNGSFLSIYKALLLTQHCNILVLISANATCFCLIIFVYTCINMLGLISPISLLVFSVLGAVVYSIILATAMVICSLALIVSGMQNRGGYLSILKACVLLLLRGRATTALSLSLFVNIMLCLTEALFHYRIVRAYQDYAMTKALVFAVLEGIFIAYLYSILLVIDTVIGCTFYRSCKVPANRIDLEGIKIVLHD